MRFYTEEHEWVRMEPDGASAVVGISEYAQTELGDITFVELPQIGARVAQGELLCVVESVKAASDIYAPIGGTVVTVNQRLLETPELINSSAEAEGWICTLADVQGEELTQLMDQTAYAAFVKERG